MPEHHWYKDLRLRTGTHQYSISPPPRKEEDEEEEHDDNSIHTMDIHIKMHTCMHTHTYTHTISRTIFQVNALPLDFHSKRDVYIITNTYNTITTTQNRCSHSNKFE